MTKQEVIDGLREMSRKRIEKMLGGEISEDEKRRITDEYVLITAAVVLIESKLEGDKV